MDKKKIYNIIKRDSFKGHMYRELLSAKRRDVVRVYLDGKTLEHAFKCLCAFEKEVGGRFHVEVVRNTMLVIQRVDGVPLNKLYTNKHYVRRSLTKQERRYEHIA